MTEQRQQFNLGEFLQKNFTIIIAAIIFFTWWTGCGKSGEGSKVNSDTTSKTTQVPQPIVIMPPYQPQQQGNTVFPINIPAQYNASADIQKLTEQYNELVKQYLAVKTYKDSIELRDTSGLKVGTVDLTQIVAENTLKSTQPTYKLNFPHTTTTITKYAPLKRQIFIGVSVESLLNKPNIQQIDIGLLFKNKTNEDIISLSGTYSLPLKQPGLKIGYYKKLQFKLW